MKSLKNKKIPDTVYNRVIALCRDYDRMRKELNALRMVEGYDVESKMRRLEFDICAVDAGLASVHDEYRDGVRENLLSGKRCIDIPYASESTWKRYRREAIVKIAEAYGL